MKPYWQRKRWIIFRRNYSKKYLFSWLKDGFVLHIPRTISIICKYKGDQKMIVH